MERLYCLEEIVIGIIVLYTFLKVRVVPTLDTLITTNMQSSSSSSPSTAFSSSSSFSPLPSKSVSRKEGKDKKGNGVYLCPPVTHAEPAMQRMLMFASLCDQESIVIGLPSDDSNRILVVNVGTSKFRKITDEIRGLRDPNDTSKSEERGSVNERESIPADIISYVYVSANGKYNYSTPSYYIANYHWENSSAKGNGTLFFYTDYQIWDPESLKLVLQTDAECGWPAVSL